MDWQEILYTVLGIGGGGGILGFLSYLIKLYQDKKKESPQASSAEIIKALCEALTKKDDPEKRYRKRRIKKKK